MKALWALPLLASLALAGCFGGGSGGSGDAIDDGLEATDDTGIIRGVVVDEAVRPVAGATVTILMLDSSTGEAASGEDGGFGFEGLPPGTYFMEVRKAGYATAQASAVVAAGVEDPELTRVLLRGDASTQPFVQDYAFSGFMECGVTSPAVGIALCMFVNDVSDLAGAGNATEDHTQATYELERVPTWVQSELVWDSTQSAGEDLALMYSYGDCGGGFYCDHEVSGGSPLLLVANQTAVETIGLGAGTPLYIRVFSDDNDQTAACAPDPAGCFAGFGATVQQEFTVYTHVFYGYEPTEGWRFSESSEVPAPPA